MNTATEASTLLLASHVEVDDHFIVVSLNDGRIISVPTSWYPRLAYATKEERRHFELVGKGIGIHWPLLDEDIQVAGLLEGKRSTESASSLSRWEKEMDRRRTANDFGT